MGDYVWFDIDADGQQDEGEPGVPNVTVTLCNSAGVFIAATSTDSTGKYLFDNLAPGTYCVMFVPGPQFAFTNANVGADATDSDADIDTGRTGTYTLAAGERNLTVDAGLIDDVDLTLNKDLAPGQVIKPGELLTFMLNVTNTGKGNEPGPITVTDYLPTGMTYVSSTPATWACHTSTGATDTVVCVRSGSLAAGASAETLYITVRVAADARGQLVNTATVKGSVHLAASAMAARMTHSPSGTISPVSSASGINSSGMTSPRAALSQRIRASKPLCLPVDTSTSGWKKRRISSAARAFRKSRSMA